MNDDYKPLMSIAEFYVLAWVDRMVFDSFYEI